MKGFILVEALVAILILSFIMAGIFGVLHIGGSTYHTSLGLVELQQQSRGAMDRLTRELRQSKASDLSIISPGEITFYVPPTNYGAAWIGPIRYYLNNLDNRIIREYPTGTEKIVANDISSLNFSLNDDLLDIQLTAARTVRGKNLSFSLDDQVRFRHE